MPQLVMMRLFPGIPKEEGIGTIIHAYLRFEPLYQRAMNGIANPEAKLSSLIKTPCGNPHDPGYDELIYPINNMASVSERKNGR